MRDWIIPVDYCPGTQTFHTELLCYSYWQVGKLAASLNSSLFTFLLFSSYFKLHSPRIWQFQSKGKHSESPFLACVYLQTFPVQSVAGREKCEARLFVPPSCNTFLLCYLHFSHFFSYLILCCCSLSQFLILVFSSHLLDFLFTLGHSLFLMLFCLFGGQMWSKKCEHAQITTHTHTHTRTYLHYKAQKSWPYPAMQKHLFCPQHIRACWCSHGNKLQHLH